jgi:ABC-2 type transport system permease protein
MGGIAMKFLRMVLVNCKKYFKDYRNIVVMFILPIVSVALVNFFIEGSERGLNVKIAVINLDKGSSGKDLTESLGVNNIYYSKDKALKELKNYNYAALYEIPENFSDNINKNVKPIINSYKLEKGNSTQVFEANLEQKINELLRNKLLKNKDIIMNENEMDKNILKVQYNMRPGLLTAGSLVPIMLIMFYLFCFSSNLSTDLLNLRKGKILERFLSTNNEGYKIMGSIYLSMLIVQVVMYTSAFLVMDIVLKIKFENFGMLLLNIALMSMVSISLVGYLKTQL